MMQMYNTMLKLTLAGILMFGFIASAQAKNKFEDLVKVNYDPKQYTLYSSLEPCPMCLTRLIDTGIGQVYYAAPDPDFGMVHCLEKLPLGMVKMARSQVFAQADCSDELKSLAEEIYLYLLNSFKEIEKVITETGISTKKESS